MCIRDSRIGTKSLAYWPYRYLTDSDSDDIIRLFEEINKSGKNLSIQAHFNHPRELSTDAVKQAILRIKNTGAQIRTDVYKRQLLVISDYRQAKN